MKIMIVSSMTFAKEILETKKRLERNNHEVSIPPDTHDSLENPNLNMDLDFLLKENLLMRGFERINTHEAILVLNLKKGDIEGYIGGASLMEIGVAYYLKKKIFILNQLPSETDLRYVCEIKQAKPTILNGDINNI